MTEDIKRLRRALASAGFVLVRQRRHQIWRRGRGTVTLPVSPSRSHRAIRNYIAQIRRKGIELE